MNYRSKCLLLCLACTTLTATLFAADHFEVVVERRVETTMRDGVILRADIYHPRAEGKFPVLLSRTPYDKLRALDLGIRAAARGYVTILQDVRGRYASEGEWYPFKHESSDGYDTIEWAAALPYSNGKVAMCCQSFSEPSRANECSTCTVPRRRRTSAAA